MIAVTQLRLFCLFVCQMKTRRLNYITLWFYIALCLGTNLFFTLCVEFRLRLFEIMALRRKYEPMREEVA
jgi:hypothetical protein